jgi:Fanconi anemia group M protein
MYVCHPLIKENTIEKRLYQDNILRTAERKNTLVVLPTGIGKTVIAILLAAKRLEKFPDSRALILAPTRPLAAQHQKTFKKFMSLPEENFQLVTGIIKPEKRKERYEKAKIIFSTPQTIENDIREDRIDLENVSLLVVDEAHRSVGNYAYTFVAKSYRVRAKNPLILALTASPGSEEERIREICENLFIQAIEIRSESDEDVKPYLPKVAIEIVKVDFSDFIEKLREKLKNAMHKRREWLKERGIRFKTKKELLEAQEAITRKLSQQKDGALFAISSIIAETIKIWHALELLETQSISALREYLDRLKEKSQGKRLFKDEDIKSVYFDLIGVTEIHPKMKKLREIVAKEFEESQEKKIIVFSHYRDNIERIFEELSTIKNCKPCKLVGQAGEDGLTQKEQIETIRRFEAGEYNCLIGSPIVEEGLHLPSVDIGIFYDAVPSEIRLIQRRGRIGRVKFGKIIFLLVRKSRDEAYFYTALRKEKRMKTILGELQKFGISRKTLYDYI